MDVAGGHVQLILTENRGAFLSLGSHMSSERRTILFSGVVALALIGGTLWLVARDHAVARVASVSLIVGGGFGNLVDRVFRSGAVTDFIFVRYGPLRTGIFNLADVFITTGVVALLLADIFSGRRTPKAG
jgi:signal peptidase II